jgi:hypothetical protein
MVKPVVMTALAVALSGTWQPPAAYADNATECTLLQFCYCVNTELNGLIEDRVAGIRKLLAAQRAQGKLIGYISTPLSSLEGGYYGVNADTAADVKLRLEKQYGADFLWMLNPGANYLLPPDQSLLPKNATGADYMLIWTRVLEGTDGLGGDFDWAYFVGPSDFAAALKLVGGDDMRAIDAYYDRRAVTDPGIKQIDRNKFRAYYALRAAVTYSYGSHDEWNIVRAINAKRREANPNAGFAKQLAIFFDGKPAPPPLFETPIVAGNAGACSQK